MVQSEIGSELVADHVSGPVHDHALGKPLIQSLRRSPHDVAASDIGVRIGHNELALDEREHRRKRCRLGRSAEIRRSDPARRRLEISEAGGGLLRQTVRYCSQT